MDTPLTRKLLAHLRVIYPEADNGPLVEQLIATMALDPASQAPPTHRNLWNQNDVLLITYGNSVVDEGEKPLVTLNKLLTNELDDCLSAVHILPFFPTARTTASRLSTMCRSTKVWGTGAMSAPLPSAST